MSLIPLDGPLLGSADARLADVVARLDEHLRGDPDLSFQVAAFHDGEPVLDAWGGPHLTGDSLTVPWSVTKNTIGFSIALLIERGMLDLDERVTRYWPEFGVKGKQAVTVRQLLSHQAGLVQATPALTWDELFDHHSGAERLAASRPFWQPGSALGYHAFTIGNLASELIFRVTNRTLHEFYETEIREPFGIDFFLGVPPSQERRRVPLLPAIRPVSDTTPSNETALWQIMLGMAGPAIDFPNDPAAWRFGHPAASGSGSARGVARLFATMVTGLEGAPPVLSADTVETVSLQQVHGYDEVLGSDHAFAIVFQKPTPSLVFGSPRAFGHTGAGGALACVDPETGIVFAWTIARSPWPGGADPRAVALAAELGTLLSP